jgi:hypothetical protein
LFFAIPAGLPVDDRNNKGGPRLQNEMRLKIPANCQNRMDALSKMKPGTVVYILEESGNFIHLKLRSHNPAETCR